MRFSRALPSPGPLSKRSATQPSCPTSSRFAAQRRPPRGLEPRRSPWALVKGPPPGAEPIPPAAHLRWPIQLAREASFRQQLLSITRSWKALSAVLVAFDCFMSRHRPDSFALPASDRDMAAWAATFQNAGAFSKYAMRIRTASRLLEMSPPTMAFTAALARGLKTVTVVRHRSSLSGPEVLAAARTAVDLGQVEFGQIWVIARQYLLRVEAELFPLQLDGRLGQPPGSTAWHSAILDQAGHVILVFRRRKADPDGAQLMRRCICTSSHPLFCGVCALGAQVLEHQRAARSPQTALFAHISPGAALEALHNAASSGPCVRITWHGLRRGMAGDLLRQGSSFKRIVTAGGWRSSVWERYVPSNELVSRRDAELHLPSDESD